MNNEWDREVVNSIAGKKLPLLDRVEIYPIEEEQPRYLAFLNNETDMLDTLYQAYATQVNAEWRGLRQNLKKQGIRVFEEIQPEILYDEFNMEDPIVGGYDAQHVALRRAMVMGHNRDQEAQAILKNHALISQSPIPPGVVGYDPTFTAGEQEYNPERAKALLDMFGYVDRDGDGYREQPDGSQLTITYLNRTGLQYTSQAELWAKSMKDIGIRFINRQVQFTDMLRDEQAGKFMVAVSAWIADYPDAQNFLQLLYGPNTGSTNRARFKLPRV